MTRRKTTKYSLAEMSLAVISHKVCRASDPLSTAYATDGGFPLQMHAISSLFRETKIVVPCDVGLRVEGLSEISGKDLNVIPLVPLSGTGIRRKLSLPFWLLRNGRTIWRAVKDSDAVHTPIPGDVGTIGMVFALLQSKPLFVRHCGNWLVQKTLAEHLWRWAMERFAGEKNVMLATGGGKEPPSKRNENIKWIFSTSRSADQIALGQPRSVSVPDAPKLIIVCRQEPRKGTEIVIRALPAILRRFPNASVSIVGDGSLLPRLRLMVSELGLEGNVTFHGKVSQLKVTELMSEADVFCYPTSASEGFPKVVLEALSVGLPVITTRVSVLPELIGGGCGILLDEPSPQSLAEAVTDICSDELRFAEMSRSAIGAAKPYSLEAWANLIRDNLQHSWFANTSNAKVELQEKLIA